MSFGCSREDVIYPYLTIIDSWSAEACDVFVWVSGVTVGLSRLNCSSWKTSQTKTSFARSIEKCKISETRPVTPGTMLHDAVKELQRMRRRGRASTVLLSFRVGRRRGTPKCRWLRHWGSVLISTTKGSVNGRNLWR